MIGLWILVILFYSTRNPATITLRSWFESLKFTAAEWLIWAFLAPAIIRLDRLLPVSRNEFFHRFLYHVPLSLVVSLFAVSLRELVRQALTDGIGNLSLSIYSLKYASLRGVFHFHVLIYWAVMGVHLAYSYNNRLKEQEIQNAKLEQSFSEARLATLRAQMHPHFLFNTLNAISAQVERDPGAACRLLEQLGELLRFSLDYSEAQEIPLSEEIAFVNRYMALQKARFTKRLEVTTTVDPETLDAIVPTFILEHFVENAIRHGIASRPQGGVVEIQTQKENGWLRLSVKDNGPGLSPDWNAKKGSKIGIYNTCERLRRLYGEKNFILNISNREEGGVLVELLLPFRSTDDILKKSTGHA